MLVESIKYQQIEEKDLWRISMVKELIEIKQGNVTLPEDWSREDLDSILNIVCTE